MSTPSEQLITDALSLQRQAQATSDPDQARRLRHQAATLLQYAHQAGATEAPIARKSAPAPTSTLSRTRPSGSGSGRAPERRAAADHLTISQAAQQLRTTPDGVYRLIANGLLRPVTRNGQTVGVPRVDVQARLTGRRADGASAIQRPKPARAVKRAKLNTQFDRLRAGTRAAGASGAADAAGSTLPQRRVGYVPLEKAARTLGLTPPELQRQLPFWNIPQTVEAGVLLLLSSAVQAHASLAREYVAWQAQHESWGL